MLAAIIRQKIDTNGSISFHDFMEMSLYYPGLGYYTSEPGKIGKNGDYYTSPYVTPLFGAMIGRQLEEMWQLLGKGDFTIVEYGAGTGFLCQDILNYLKNIPALYDKVQYCIIEKSEAMRRRGQQLLSEKVSWHQSLEDISPVTGCILSNELLDNFPVHSVIMKEQLMEVFVSWKNGFTETLQPAAAALTNYLQELAIRLPENYRAEINLAAIHWIQQVALHLHKGYVLTIDYGYPAAELYSPARKEGTLVCYHQHTVNDNPYCAIGEQDITTHVNFSALQHWGEKGGLQTCGFTRQANFLLALGIGDYLNALPLKDNNLYAFYKRRQFIVNTLLMDMGSRLKVLIQQKGMAGYPLAGLSMG